MTYVELKNLSHKLFFTIEDLVDGLKIKPESARVLCSRNVKNGVFIRLKNNFYVLDQNWAKLNKEDFLRLANYLQVPSYVSFMTALTYYEISTQIQRDFYECCSLKRSRKFDILGVSFNYYKIKPQFYFDFTKMGDIFIATKEKAFVDAVYLYSLGKYRLDFASLNLKKLAPKALKKIIRRYPQKTRLIVREKCRI